MKRSCLVWRTADNKALHTEPLAVRFGGQWTMKLTREELEFLSAWAREEWEPAYYRLPAHRLQLAHGVSGAQLIVFIKSWVEAEGKKDLEMQDAAANALPIWPWSTSVEFDQRLAEACRAEGHKRFEFARS